MRGVGELRVKESDRIALMAAGLEACGVMVEEEPEGMIVTGLARANHRVRGGATVETHGDHRVAMAHLIMGLAGRRPDLGGRARHDRHQFPGVRSPDAGPGRRDRRARAPGRTLMAGFCIAIDGPAASGKGTIATGLGRELGLPVLDSGLLYRAVGVTVQREGGDPADAATAEAVARRLDPRQARRSCLPHPRGRRGGQRRRRPSRRPAALKEFQQSFAALEPGAVIDGRDIGTVIAPGAPAKIFVTASPEVRAERRYKQLVGQGEAVAYEDILADIRRRDERDSGRAALAPGPGLRRRLARHHAKCLYRRPPMRPAVSSKRRAARWEASLKG